MEELGKIFIGLEPVVNLIVGICAIAALCKKNLPIEEKLDRAVEKLYAEEKKNLATVNRSLEDHERRIATLEGRCQTLNMNGRTCARR